MMTQRDNGKPEREPPMVFGAFGPVPFPLNPGKWDIRDTAGTTERDIIAGCDRHGMSHPAPSLLVVHDE